MIGQSVSRNSIILGAFAIITTGMIVLTANLTRDKIAEEKSHALERSLLEVMPAALVDNELLESSIDVEAATLLGTRNTEKAYIAKQDDQPTGIILQAVAPEGYGGSINLLVGIAKDGEVTGVRVIPPHFETPGLGDAIEIQKSDWITSFNGKSLHNLSEPEWRVKKDGGSFDAFTGATITPRAVVAAVYRSLQYFEQHKVRLLHNTTTPAHEDQALIEQSDLQHGHVEQTSTPPNPEDSIHEQ
ncbi:electron transport complex subunit RsxG [Ketobacter sp. MCCC 1A13808]|uniref:electron transport complex subunit RsxG n=1 Tax=Ketobacter sp. MCCC 1A13808 TaxID=2602738 RepID=UPI000F1ED8AB|nr:electron transport complex subunit RsxG [Ketobacter sp. MCCC 1A13808]MVF10800.1 electron transport complex subunit RsxG [Ketobacter sp. MCCC 1A13808]RLP56211.1 MAG: electron transport complex subunit RsxG [Ketobacter sp.]